jgi:hypothetical protein
MSDITPPDWVLREAAERSELSNDTPRQRAILFDTNPSFRALCRAIEQHEAFKQEVSDVMTYIKALYPTLPRNFYRFIIPKPNPDPLYKCLEEALARNGDDLTEHTDRLRAALEARGLEIKEIPPPEGDGGQQRIAGGEAKDNTKQGQSK